MKYILFIMILLVSACSNKESELKSDLSQAERNLREVRLELSSCENKLSSLSSSSKEEVASEPEAPAEPQYESVSIFVVSIDGRTVMCETKNNEVDPDAGDDSNNSNHDESPSCGMSFSDCTDGYKYRCLQNVKYKIITQKKLVKDQ